MESQQEFWSVWCFLLVATLQIHVGALSGCLYFAVLSSSPRAENNRNKKPLLLCQMFPLKAWLWNLNLQLCNSQNQMKAMKLFLWSWYEGRHTAPSHLLVVGISIKKVESRSGHPSAVHKCSFLLLVTHWSTWLPLFEEAWTHKTREISAVDTHILTGAMGDSSGKTALLLLLLCHY